MRKTKTNVYARTQLITASRTVGSDPPAAIPAAVITIAKGTNVLTG